MNVKIALATLGLLGSAAVFAGTTTPAATAPSAQPAAQHMSKDACKKEAAERKLQGKERDSFVRSCEGKK